MFPLELARRVIRLFTDEGDIVLDPFLGSGTTAIAAIETKRNFIGNRNDEKICRTCYCNIEKLSQYRKRINSLKH